MNLIRTEVLSIFDIRVDTAKDAEVLATRLARRRRTGSRMKDLLGDSYGWIFYEDQHTGFELLDSRVFISAETLPMLT